MRFSLIVGLAISCFVSGVIAQECDSIRKDGNKYYCGEVRLKTNADFKKVLASNQEALSVYNSAAGLGSAGTLFAGIGGGLVGYGLASMLFYDKPIYPTLAAVGGGIAVIGIGMAAGAGVKAKKAFQLYNTGKKKGTTSGIFLNIYPNQVALTLLW
jgi:hypothetical protein